MRNDDAGRSTDLRRKTDEKRHDIAGGTAARAVVDRPGVRGGRGAGGLGVDGDVLPLRKRSGERARLRLREHRGNRELPDL